MKDQNFKVGDRVTSEYFGNGVVIGIRGRNPTYVNSHRPIIVKFDDYIKGHRVERSFTVEGCYTRDGESTECKITKLVEDIDLTGATKIRLRTLDDMCKDPNVTVGNDGKLISTTSSTLWTSIMSGEGIAGKVHKVNKNKTNENLHLWNGRWNFAPWMVAEVLERKSDVKVDFKITKDGKEIDIKTLSDESILAMVRA